MDAAPSRAMFFIARGAAFCAGAIGLTDIAGFVLHVQALVQFVPGFPAMSPVTATGLITLAIAMLAESAGALRRNTWAAATTIFVAACVLSTEAVAGGDVFDPFIIHKLTGAGSGFAASVSPATAICLGGLALAALWRERPFIADSLAGLALLIAGLAVLGYAYDINSFYGIPAFNTMSPQTAVSLLLLAVSSLCLRGGGGWVGIVSARDAIGRATRRQLAVTLSLPLAGWCVLERMNDHQLRPATAVAILVILTIVPLTLLILRDGYVLAMLDQERGRNAAVLAGLAQDMEHRLERQAAELMREGHERAKAEAAVARAQRMEAIGQLTGGVAHDFNNLLTVIKGSLQLLALQLPDAHQGRRALDMAMTATERGAAVTRQFLTFSRSQKLDVRAVAFDPVLNGVRGLLGNAVGPAIGITVRLNAADAWAMTDPDQLELAILNLAVNARDAMPNGGELIVQSQQRRVCLEGQTAPADYVSVSVTDTGHGMTPEVLARAAEPFFTTKDRGKGSGLGLAQVYGFAHQCQGGLRIDSLPGHGTTVEILLPATSASADAEGPAVAPTESITTEAGSANQTILVIDDEAHVREVVGAALRRIGYNVVEARDGRDGLERLQTLQPAVAVIDFIMPGLNGAEVARRARQRHPDMPIIFMSGYFDTVALDGIARSVLLRKPFDLSGLQKTVSAMVP